MHRRKHKTLELRERANERTSERASERITHTLVSIRRRISVRPYLLFFSPETIRRHCDDALAVNRGLNPHALSLSEASRNHEGEKDLASRLCARTAESVHHWRGRRRASLFALI